MNNSEKKKYQCTICGFIEEFEGDIPSDFVCPVCGATADKFVEIKD